ncbi:MAG: glycosyltransferase family 4 protein [Ignavibacteriae bacterium]|nr:glycosyltransferase family 4 protein [Ignavibacteriota bacterium]
MKKVLYSIYTGEYPNQFAGGPNNIIYKIINNYKEHKYQFDYLSSDMFKGKLTSSNLIELGNNLSQKKKTASFLTKKSSLYRKFFGSDFYLPYHFYKKNKHYKLFSERKNNYYIIHSQDSISLSLITSKNIPSKKIMTVHSKGPLSDELRNMAMRKNLRNSIDRKLKEIELKNIGLADIITFPSKAAKDYYEKSLNIKLDTNKVRIIYNGIDFDKIKKINDDGVLAKYSVEEKEDRLLLLNIATHTSEKNIDILLKVVNAIKDKYKRDVLLLNIGAEGTFTQKLNTLVKKLDIEGNVKFLGKLPNNDVIKLLIATDIFIMTSEKVIFDLVVLEALACGACCVVSNEGGNKEIIKDDDNGYLFDINDVDEIANKIISINPNKVKDNAIKTAKQFSVQKMVNEYFEVYENLLNEVQ